MTWMWRQYKSRGYLREQRYQSGPGNAWQPRKVKHVVRLGGFIATSPDFLDQALVLNGISDLMVEVLGNHGRHTRSTSGVPVLPKGASVEVEAIFEII